MIVQRKGRLNPCRIEKKAKKKKKIKDIAEC